MDGWAGVHARRFGCSINPTLLSVTIPSRLRFWIHQMRR
jgi:hypothetical protein